MDDGSPTTALVPVPPTGIRVQVVEERRVGAGPFREVALQPTLEIWYLDERDPPVAPSPPPWVSWVPWVEPLVAGLVWFLFGFVWALLALVAGDFVLMLVERRRRRRERRLVIGPDVLRAGRRHLALADIRKIDICEVNGSHQVQIVGAVEPWVESLEMVRTATAEQAEYLAGLIERARRQHVRRHG